MKLPICFILVIMLFYPVAKAQNFTVTAGTGVGTFSLKDFKEFNEYILRLIPVPAKIVDNFPPYLYYRFKGLFENKNAGFGLSVTHYSTGSLIHYSDYSGSISVKQLVRSNVIGVPLSLKLAGNKKLQVSFQMEPGIAFTSNEIKESLELFEERYQINYKDRTESFFISTGFSLSYYYKIYCISSFFGYFFNRGSKLYFGDGDNEITLFDPSDKNMKSNISGLRFEIMVGVRIPGGRER